MDGQGNFKKDWESQGKVRDLKINGYGRHSESLFIVFKRG